MSNSTRVQGETPDGDTLPVSVDFKGKVLVAAAQEAVTGTTQGPATIATDTAGNVTLVTAPGVGFAVRVKMVQITFGVAGSTTVQTFKAGSGGIVQLQFTSDSLGIPVALDPPWLLPENTAFVTERIAGTKASVINYHFYVDTV